MTIRVRAVTLVEVLAASLIFGVGVAGSFSGLTYAYNLVVSGRYESAMRVVAQSELERAKVWGYSNLPCGVYSAVTKTGSWSGAFDQTLNGGLGGWSQAAATSYDTTGAQVPAASPTAAFSLTTTIMDSGPNQVLPTAVGNGYTLDFYAVRTVSVTVKCSSPFNNSVSVSSTIVRGGV